ncbi:MAG: translocation/assembly module TamB domain-containing protein [Bacteroidales bacterium]|nr:translocation/assembly module TamB domain-containing protein [Bacteroidales bacterium]
MLLLMVLLVPVMLYGLLHTRVLQTWVLNRITSYVSNELQTEITVGNLEFKPFRSLLLSEVNIKDQSDGDLLFVDEIAVDIGRLSLRHNVLYVKEIRLDQALIRLTRDDPYENFNFRFIFDYIEQNQDSNRRAGKWHLSFASVSLSDTDLTFRDVLAPNRDTGLNPSDIQLSNVYLAVSDIVLANEQLAFELDYFRAKESRGFVVNHLSTSAKFSLHEGTLSNFLLRTRDSELMLNSAFEYRSDTTKGFSLDDLYFKLELKPSTVASCEVGYFLPFLYGAEDVLSISGVIQGSANNLVASNLDLSAGKHTRVSGDLALYDINDVEKARLNARITELRSSIEDISSFRLPASHISNTLDLPGYVHNLGHIHFTGDLDGSLDDFTARGSLETDIGVMNGDVVFQKTGRDTLYQYKGTLQALDFDAGQFFDTGEYLGKVSMFANLSGQGFFMENLDISIEGSIASLEFMNNNYSNLALRGGFANKTFNGSFLVDDADLFLDFKGTVDFSDEIPVFDFHALVDQAYLSKMNIYQRDPAFESVLSANMFINAQALSLDDLEGTITIRDIIYEEYPLDKRLPEAEILRYFTDSLFISNTLWADNNKHLRIRSAFLDTDLYGQINFAQIGQSAAGFINHFMPALFNNKPLDESTVNGLQDIDYSIRFKDTEELTSIFFPAVSVAHNHAEIEARAAHLNFAGREFIDWHIVGERDQDQFEITTFASKLAISDSLFLDRFEARTVFFSDTVLLKMQWNDQSEDMHNQGRLNGVARFYSPGSLEFVFLPSEAYFRGDLWRFNVDNKIIIDKERLEIKQLVAYHEDQFIRADGVFSADDADQMLFSFANFDVALSAHLMRTQNFEFGGIMDGYITLKAMYQPLSIGTELFVTDFSFNHDRLGDLEVNSLWDAEKQAFAVETVITDVDDSGFFHPLIATGYIHPAGGDQNFDLDIKLDNKKMSVWGRYMKNFAQNFDGRASGRLRLDGPFHSPELSGKAFVNETELYIPYLNTRYSFSHEVEFAKNYFYFDNIMLTDTLGNRGRMYGYLYHDRFKYFSFDLRLNPERMIIFNKDQRHRDYYFGTAFISGLIHIYGPADNVFMDVNARTNRGTSVMVPLNYSGEIRESHFISFVSRDPLNNNNQPFSQPAIPGGITMNFDLEVTPDADVQLFFDTRFGDIIRGRGSGNLKLEISPQGAFNIYGDYVIEDGEYIFSLQNIINKRFRIEQGSTIRWTGDLNDADVDLRAAYRLRTALYDLLVGEGIDPETAELYRRRVPVETMLILEDKLFNPAISFEIQVPGGDESVRDLIERIITTEQEMNRQVFSLLVLNRFMPATTDQYNTALGYGVGSTSSELLSNQLSNWLSQISNDFDIGINYRPGDELSSQEVELALSTQLFDDRVLIDGNFGVAGNQTATGHSTQATSQIIGDVNVEVKITPEGKFRVKAFNRSNTFDIINTNSPYTQGIGLFYRREFDDLSELFRRQRQSSEGLLMEPEPPTSEDEVNLY